MATENLDTDYRYFERDISWLSFNYRVLMEAADKSVPLYERVKFLAIYSSNLDEFFRVRVAALRSIVDIDKKKINKRFNRKPSETLELILKEVNRQLEEFGIIKREVILPELKEHGIILYRNEEVHDEHRSFIEHFFKSKVLSYLQPIVMTAKNSSPPYLDNRALYFAVDLEDVYEKQHFAHLRIPTENLDRFVSLPQLDGMHYYMMIDDVIRENISFLFPGYRVKGCYAVKLNRDADLHIEDEYSGNLVKKIRKQIEKRNLGVPSRFLYDRAMPGSMLAYLVSAFDLKEEDLVPGGRYHNMHDLMDLVNPLSPKLENEPLPPIRLKSLENGKSIFEIIDQGDKMLHFPYQSYDYVLRFFNEASMDPTVEEIKATFYRIAPDSFISNALISAASNGKKVTVFVEIKARFDEHNNLLWAEKMKAAGVSIVYSIPGLKVHAKVALVKRRLAHGKQKRYGFFGTGNFNEKTASIYADEALLSSHEEMTDELDQVFLFLHENKEPETFKHLLVSQFNMVDAFKEMVDYEIAQAKAGKKAKIVLKLNNMQDDKVIEKLYEASNAGVKIELIIRAICCIKPGIKGMSENITAKRIVDRYLEHSRVYYFYHGGKEKLFMGSADWMKRNLYRRIEVVFPIYDTQARAEIKKLLEIQLNDNTKACCIDEDLKNIRVKNNKPKIQSQVAFYNYLKNLEENDASLEQEKRASLL
ncbi:polyphosphate kinase 1 [Fulvivirga sp. RKSG066]|uniref:polyphosphate kinase 1 n=1 Tax=Fulvivirga aurantia TaxID=2529383 RepID=UPI0012BCFCAC|nr:polyphosphate kinase 1 [Fulvivirga aurantia]MTI21886.1 polyphosphate kinase 1 [Fulvivirga aurantia]